MLYPAYLKDTNGKITSSHSELCSIAASHLKSLFQNKDTCSEPEIETFLSKLNLPKFTVEEKEILTNPFTLDELENVIAKKICRPENRMAKTTYLLTYSKTLKN